MGSEGNREFVGQMGDPRENGLLWKVWQASAGHLGSHHPAQPELPLQDSLLVFRAEFVRCAALA